MGWLPISHFKFDTNNLITDKLRGLVDIRKAGAYLYYQKNELVKELLREIKYNQNTELAYDLGVLSVQNQRDIFRNSIDVILPIPLHKHKLQIRGYNQTMYLAQGMSDILDITVYDHVLLRAKNTSTQTKLNRENRFENLDDAFEVKNSSLIQKKHILIVDDVITTGATIAAACRTLMKHDVASTNIFTLTSSFADN